MEHDTNMEHGSEETNTVEISSSDVGTFGDKDSGCFQSAFSPAELFENRTSPSTTQQISDFISLFASEQEANASGLEYQNSVSGTLKVPSYEMESCQQTGTSLDHSSPHAVNDQHMASKSDDRSELSTVIKEFKQTLEETSDCCRIEQMVTMKILEYFRMEAGDNAERFFELLRSIVNANEKGHT
ncbi:hypothetical protein AB6A40_005266 [Gnathostoma spinigerum]|uniref:Uncharacterized protein n=1 Tax=Gnathostoma spinigerum TaxID=75299 RepID=A0ABD6EPF4_9BILA